MVVSFLSTEMNPCSDRSDEKPTRCVCGVDADEFKERESRGGRVVRFRKTRLDVRWETYCEQQE
jgi:hypothetical protein